MNSVTVRSAWGHGCSPEPVTFSTHSPPHSPPFFVFLIVCICLNAKTVALQGQNDTSLEAELNPRILFQYNDLLTIHYPEHMGI